MMKKITFTLAVLLLSTIQINAQENVDVKKETVTKKVVTKGTTVETTVINDVTEEINVIKVEETDAVNQVPTVVSETNEMTEIAVDTVVTNEVNNKMVDEYQKKENAETQKAIDAQRAEKKRIDSDVEAIKKANQAESNEKKKVTKKVDN